MRKIRQSEDVECDMCHANITNYPKYQMKLKDSLFDLCEHCISKVKLVMNFLDVVVGIDFGEYNYSKGEE